MASLFISSMHNGSAWGTEAGNYPGGSMEAINFQTLTSRQREDRDGYPAHLALRIHHALSNPDTMWGDAVYPVAEA